MGIIRPFGGTEPRVDPSVLVLDGALVIGDVEIGPDSSIWFGTVLRGDVNRITIGARTNLQDQTVVHVTRGTHPTVVGDDVTVGHRVTLHGCTVHDRSLVGIGAIVMDGAVVGPDAMVGAGALVPPNMIVPPGVLVVGAPARVKRSLTPAELAHLRESARNYVEYARQYRREGWGPR
ncbi:MAG TPA: gamma carbonic anhydrase family protein [Anaeromyxobacteraceae bacterium]|nr:gamma carbonic anhydrase family protein [Anaeromyxobacteraceae bacterium]